MSRIRDLLMDRIHNPKPIAHWDFSRYKDSDMTKSVNYVEDLTGNGYDLRLNGFDFSIKSGFEGYAQDFNKVDGSELISKSRNIVKLIRDSDGYDVSIDKGSYNNTTYIVKVTLPEGVSELLCSCYIGDSYADYGLSADRENQTLVNGINIIQPFSEEYFNNCKYIAFFALSYTDKPCVVEQFPLNPFSLVFNNCAAITKKAVALPNQKGFTFIANRKYLDKTIRTVFWGKYLTGSDNGYIIGDYYKGLSDSGNIIFVCNETTLVGKFAQVKDGILWFSDKLYNGEIPLNKGTSDNVDSPLCIGTYSCENPDESYTGEGHYAISEAWVFNKTLTKEQVERFIAENATPLPQVYYDVEKQGTLDSDTNKDKIIDFSGNNNHGTLNNFTYDSYYTDEVNSLKLNDTNKGDSTLENGILTILNHTPGYVAISSAITEGTSVTVPSFKIKVTGVTNDKYINILWQNADGAHIIQTIKSDGIYTIPKYDVTVNGATNAIIINALGGSFTEPCIIEFLENSNGWGDYDAITDSFVTFNAGVYSKPVLTLDKTNPEYGVAHTLLRSSQQTVSADNTVVRSPEIKMLVHRIEGSEITAGYIKNNVRGEGEFISIDTPGIYTVPSYPVTVNTTDNYYGFCVMDSGCTELEVEFLPSNVEPSYISDKLVARVNQSGDTVSVSGHTVTYTASVDKKMCLIGSIGIKESNIKGRINIKSYGGLGDIILTKVSASDPISIGDFAENDIAEINITQDYIDRGYSFIIFRTTSSVTAGDKFTVELLPDLNSYIQFNPPLVSGPQGYITLPSNNTQGYKTVFALVEIPENFEREQIYKQSTGSTGLICIDIFPSQVVSGENPNGDCFINGKLNTQIVGSSLGGKIVLITCRNQNTLNMASTRGEIGYTGGWANHFKLYKFMGFSECLTDNQIKRVIEKYSLMSGVDDIDVSGNFLNEIHYVADWDAKGRSNDEEGGGYLKMDR